MHVIIIIKCQVLWLFEVLFVGIKAGFLASARNFKYYHIILLNISRHKERNLITFSMRTTVNYIDMHIYFETWKF